MKHILSKNSRSTLSGVQPGDSQPNAVDLRLDKVFRISESLFQLDEENKKHRGSYEMKPDPMGYWNLPEGHYEVVMENIINVGEAEAGWVITRSTLNRNGVFITSGLYDTGYNGVMAGMMHVSCGPFRVKRGTRVGQYISFDAESLTKYSGSYGLGSEHDQKYNVVAIPKKINLHEQDVSDDQLIEVYKKNKSLLNWYQRKKVNQLLKERKEEQEKQAVERDRVAREDIERRTRADNLQAVAMHIVVPGKAE